MTHTRTPINQRNILNYVYEHGAMSPAELALAFGWGKRGLDRIHRAINGLIVRGELEYTDGALQRGPHQY